MGVATGAGVGRRGERGFGLFGVQRVVELRDRGGAVAERRVSGDVLDPLAVDIDLAAVAQRFQKFRAGERAVLAGKDCFGVVGHRLLHTYSPSPAGGGWPRSGRVGQYGRGTALPDVLRTSASPCRGG